MDLSYFTNSPDEERVFTLDINDVISRDGGINGAMVNKEISLINQHVPDAKRIDFVLNTEGGSITEGVKIASGIVASKIKTRTINMGYAASMGGVIAIVADERKGVDFGLWMLHNPRGRGIDLKDTLDPKMKETLSKMKDQLMQLIINRTGIEKVELSTILDNETWMNFEDAKKHNFVDGKPLVFGKRPKIVAPEMAIYENIKSINDFHSSLESVDNTNINIKENHMEDLKKQFEARIVEKDTKIDDLTGTVATQTSEIDTLKSDFKNATAEKAELAKEITAQATIIQGYKDEEAVSFVEKAIAEGKFPETEKDSLIVQAKASFESFKTLVNVMTPVKKLEGTPKPKISELLELAAATAGIAEGKDLEGLTKFEWLQKNDSKKLAEIKALQPDMYKALTDEFVNSKNSK